MDKTKTILVVDDSEPIRQAVSYMLRSKGINVLQGEDGNDALRHFNGTPIHLLITDLHMPNMDGIGLIKEVRKMEDYSRIPILVLTTESQVSMKMEARQAGATGWIVKPFESEKLIAIIRKVLR
ncbi:MAG: response regulator [Bacteroidales bacterium]|nr:response regulator [Bacteroidales bacterium]